MTVSIWGKAISIWDILSLCTRVPYQPIMKVGASSARSDASFSAAAGSQKGASRVMAFSME